MLKKILVTCLLALAVTYSASSCDSLGDSDNPPVFFKVKDVHGYIVDLYDHDVDRTALMTFNYAPDKKGKVRLVYDPQYLKEYNSANGIEFALFPQDYFKLKDGGVVSVSPEGGKRYNLGITISPLGVESYNNDVSYAIPLKVVPEGKGMTVSEKNSHIVYWVRNLAGYKELVRKPEEKKVFCYLSGGNNPLNVLQWEGEDGRLLVDVAVVFAYNINYDRSTGKVYIHANDNCQYILDHANEIIQPLRERGVKVLLGVLGNHDPAGLAQLSPIGCKDFARQVADMCKQYNFDGVNYDDEYSTAPDLNNPLMCPVSSQAGSRLCLETKKVMPDKLVTIFQWGHMYGENEVDGYEAGDFIDIAVGNYGTKGQPKKGMSNLNCSIASVEMAQGNKIAVNQARGWAQTNYGYVMLFGTWGNRNSGSVDHFNSLSHLAEGLYGTPLKTPEVFYPFSKSLETKPFGDVQ